MHQTSATYKTIAQTRMSMKVTQTLLQLESELNEIILEIWLLGLWSYTNYGVGDDKDHIFDPSGNK